MSTDMVTLQLPANRDNQLQELATEEKRDPVEVISQLVSIAYQQRGWLRDLTTLREQIQQEGGLPIGTTKEEVLEQLRQTRRKIFEAEYAHLYR
jgi:hypothetical protein